MKKVLLTSLIALMLSCAQAFAADMAVQYLTETLTNGNTISRNFTMRSSDGANYRIEMTPLDEAITSSDGTTTIPITNENFYVHNTREDVFFKFNEASLVTDGVDLDSESLSLMAVIKDYGIVPAGTYTLRMAIHATNLESNETIDTSFNFEFIIPVDHVIGLGPDIPKISVSASDVFKKTDKITNESTSMINIRSNTDWILTLDARKMEEFQGKLYVRTTAGSDKVSSRLQEYALITPGTSEIILARGAAPAENEYVSVEYSMENPTEGAIPAGEYFYKVKYLLTEGQE